MGLWSTAKDQVEKKETTSQRQRGCGFVWSTCKTTSTYSNSFVEHHWSFSSPNLIHFGFRLCQSPGRRNTLHNMMQYIKSVKSVSDRKCCPMMVIVATTPTVGCSITCLIQTLQLQAMIRVSVFKLLFARELADLGIDSWLFQLHVASHQCSHEVCYTVCCIKVCKYVMKLDVPAFEKRSPIKWVKHDINHRVFTRQTDLYSINSQVIPTSTVPF